MSFKNFLDLRRKPPQQTQIIERIILQKRSWKSDLFLAFSVILVASGIIWGISKADTFIESINRSQIKNFSATGIVLNIDATNIYLDQAKGSDDQGKSTYTFDLSTVTKVETNQYVTISFSDIKAGDKVVVQGQEDGGNISIKRIISFGLVIPLVERAKEEVATTTEPIATTTALVVLTSSTTTEASSPTPEVTSATSTISISSIEETSTTTDISSTTESTATTTTIMETITDVVGGAIDTVKDAVQTVIDTVTGSSTELIQTPADLNSEPIIETPTT